jgi:S-layer protein (TIGR01567 family)
VNHLHAAIIIAVLVSLLIVSEADALDSIEIRSAVGGTINGWSNLVDNTFTWNPQNFAGFFYDIENDLGTETLKFVLTENNRLSGDNPYGITYTTTAQSKDFEHELWGSYKIIGFQAERYFAGYNRGVDELSGSNIFYAESTDKNSLSNEQLEQILMDDDSEMTVTSGTPLKLEEGYELAIKLIDIDNNKVYLELSKNGAVIDSKVISPSKDGATEADKTYYYKNPAVGEQKKLVTIGVHFKNAFRGADYNLASIDGVWQISDTPKEVKADTQYDKMTISTVDATAGTITMDNKDYAVTLSKNKDATLTGDIKIRTADNDTLRFYIYKTITQPGDYQVRGAVAGTVNGASNLVDNSFSWNPQTFAGFFYDIKKDLGTESLEFDLTEDNKLSGDIPYGVTYITTVQNKAFERTLWGSYKIIGFLADRYFAGYNKGVDEQSGSNIFYIKSLDENSLSSKQLEQILIDNRDEKTVTSGTPLKLEDGYELVIKSIDIDGNKVYLELSKNGAVVDSNVVSPSKDGATEVDKTYYYRNPQVGEQKKLVTIGVHFKNAFRGADSNLATVDGIWQISDTPIDVSADTQYGKMTINYFDPINGIISMNNKDNAITLRKNKNVELMPGVSIQTADNDTLRFFIYKPVTIDGSAVTAAETISIDSTPAAETTPVAEQNRAVEVAPAAEIIPVAEVNKAVENASAVEAAPSVGTTPTYASGAAPTTEKTAEPGVSDFLRNLATTLTLFGSLYASARLIKSYTTTNISIISPKDNDQNWTGFVEGTSKRVDGKVKYIYVIIRLDDGQLLVAKKAKLDKRGFWEAKCNIPKSITYNIYAIVMDDALNEIKEGEMLEKIPNHLAITHVASISRASDFSFKD